MKKLAILAATAAIAFTGVACSPMYDTAYGTSQPSGGKVADNIAAASGGISGSVTGAANMNGPNRNGQPFDDGFYLRNSSPYDD